MRAPRLPAGRSRWLVGGLLAALMGLVALVAIPVARRAAPLSSAQGQLSGRGTASPTAEEEGHPVFAYPAASSLHAPPPPEARTPPASPLPAGPGRPRRSSTSVPSRPRSQAGAPASQPIASPPQGPDPQGTSSAGTSSGGSATGSSPRTGTASETALAPAHPGAPPPSNTAAPAPAVADHAPGPSPAPAPVLRPPVPLDQPPLHPVLRAAILPGPGGGSALEEASLRGRVKVRLLIRADGGVASVDVVISSGNTALDEAARLGLLRWRFAPATRDGVPIDAYLLLWITFSG